MKEVDRMARLQLAETSGKEKNWKVCHRGRSRCAKLEETLRAVAASNSTNLCDLEKTFLNAAAFCLEGSDLFVRCAFAHTHTGLNHLM